MKQCELCDAAARLYCESDRASLCWECDAKVHGANFLVGRHSRALLCRRCQSPTPWRAEGARLGPTVSVCEACCLEGSLEKGQVGGGRIRNDEEVNVESEQRRRMEDEDEDGDDEEDDEDDEGEDEEEEGEIQVVPWTMTPPPPPSSSSSEGEETVRAGNGGGFLKRTRESADLLLSDQDDPMASSSQRNRWLSPEYESSISFVHGESPPSSGRLAGSEPFRSAISPRPAAALDVGLHGDGSAVGVVSHGHCRPPI